MIRFHKPFLLRFIIFTLALATTTGVEAQRPGRFKSPPQVTCLAYSPDGKILATSFFDGKITLRDADSGKELASLAGHKTNVFKVAFSPYGKSLASISQDKTLRLWDVATGEMKVVAGKNLVLPTS